MLKQEIAAGLLGSVILCILMWMFLGIYYSFNGEKMPKQIEVKIIVLSLLFGVAIALLQ